MGQSKKRLVSECILPARSVSTAVAKPLLAGVAVDHTGWIVNPTITEGESKLNKKCKAFLYKRPHRKKSQKTGKLHFPNLYSYKTSGVANPHIKTKNQLAVAFYSCVKQQCMHNKSKLQTETIKQQNKMTQAMDDRQFRNISLVLYLQACTGRSLV